ncbi:MAG: hypothetical protein KKG59_04405 [Nanoarchaeota archaeon]|nr:hypothetical protein [Nanoarchaeota archaeon]
MERKLIPQGTKRNRSYTITLPMTWVKNNGLDALLNVNLDIIDNKILIGTEKIFKTKTTIDATNLDFIIKKLVAEKYKKGIDEIRINFKDTSTLNLIRDLVEKELIGFEMLEHTRTHCIIRDISKSCVESFEKTLRRCFHVLHDVGNEVVEATSKQDYDYLPLIKNKDLDLNKLTYFCERQLNKKNQEYFGKIQFYFFLLERIENIGDMYKGICTFMLESKKPMQKNTIKLIQHLNQTLQSFIELFFSDNFDYEQAQDHYVDQREFRLKMLDHYNPENPDLKYMYYIGSLVQANLGMTRCLFSLKET